jgi:hypothetical protein
LGELQYILSEKSKIDWQSKDAQNEESTLRPDKPARLTASHAAAVKSGARTALQKLMEPLAGFARDCGLSVNEVILLLQEGAVRSAARQQYQKERRTNISGIAAMTGISRAKASRILREDCSAAAELHDRYLSPINRILKAWYSDPKYLTAEREPAELKLYGRGLTFESLVNQYGRGLPVRAILDELTRIDAIDLRASQGIHPRTSVAVDRRITAQMFRVLGRGAVDLFFAVSQETRPGVSKTPKMHSDRRRNFRRAG